MNECQSCYGFASDSDGCLSCVKPEAGFCLECKKGIIWIEAHQVVNFMELVSRKLKQVALLLSTLQQDRILQEMEAALDPFTNFFFALESIFAAAADFESYQATLLVKAGTYYILPYYLQDRSHLAVLRS